MDRLIDRDSSGNRIVNTLTGPVHVDGEDTAEFKDILRRTIIANGFLMFWEP